jgi:hypothetical protein
MKQVFLVVCRAESSAQFVDVLNRCPGVFAWSQVWPGAILIKTTPETTIFAIDIFINSQLPMEMFLVNQVTLRVQTHGRMDQKVWDFILNG